MTTNNGLAMESAITQLRKGGILLKFCRRAPPHFINLRLSFDDKELIYNRVGSKKRKQVNILRVVDVQKGVTHRVFLGIFQFVVGQSSKLQEHAVTLSYFDKREILRKLSIACSSPEEQQLWFQGIHQIIKFHQLSKRSYTGGAADLDTFGHSHSQEHLEHMGISTRLSFALGNGTNNGASASELGLPLGMKANKAQGGMMSASTDNLVEVSAMSMSMDEELQHSQDSLSILQSPVGDLFVWGVGDRGSSLGVEQSGMNGPLADTSSGQPTILEGTDSLDVSKVAYGSSHGVLVTRSGVVYSWGEGTKGELGHGMSHTLRLPKRVEGLCQYGRETIRTVCCSNQQSFAVTSKGELFTWGSRQAVADTDETETETERETEREAERRTRTTLPSTSSIPSGRLVNEEEEEEEEGSVPVVHALAGPKHFVQWFPKQFSSLVRAKAKVLKVCCGPWHSALLTSERKLFTWGDNFLGKLGHGTDCPGYISSPRLVSDLQERRVFDVACGTWHTGAVVERLHHHLVGDVTSSHLSSSKVEEEEEEEEEAETPTEERKTRTKSTKTKTKTCPVDSSLYMWGSAEHNCLGLSVGDTGDKNKNNGRGSGSGPGPGPGPHFSPVPIGGLVGGKDLVQVECGQHHTLVLSGKGQVYQAGKSGPLCHKNGFAEVNVHHESISKIACGLHHCVVVNKKKSKVYTWGRGTEGQLGHNKLGDLKEPQSVAKLANRHILDIQCGDHYTLSVCSHIDYDDAKVERQLEKARQKFQSVVMTKGNGSPEHKEHKSEMMLRGRAQSNPESKDNNATTARKRAKSRSVIKMIAHMAGNIGQKKKKKKKSVADTQKGGGSSPPSSSSPKGVRKSFNVDSTLDVMSKLGDGFRQARSLSAHAGDENHKAALEQQQSHSQEAKHRNNPQNIISSSGGSLGSGSGGVSLDSSPLDEERRTSFLTIFKEGDNKAVPNMERLAKRIVDLERQLSQQSQVTMAARGSGPVPGPPPRKLESSAGQTLSHQQQQQIPEGKENSSSQSNQTPTHSRSSTWSLDLTNDVDSNQNFARMRKQSHSMESFATPMGPGVRSNGEFMRSNTDNFNHLAAQNQRLKQKLREMESRLRQSQADSVALSSVSVAEGVKIFIRSMKDRTELYKIAYDNNADEESFKEWFVKNKVDFMKEHGITHIDMSSLKDEFLDLMIV